MSGAEKRRRRRARTEVRFAEVTTLPANEARILAGRLQSEGIEAWIDPPDITSWPGYGYGGTPERPVKVMVRPERLEEALAIAREIAGS